MSKKLSHISMTFIFLLSASGITQAQQTEKVYLSGTGSDHTVNWDFFCTAGMNSGKWTTIPVPSCWELQGFGKYDYGFAKDSVRGKEKGLYKYSFDMPAAWKNKVVKIVFEGSMTDTEVKINGQSAGETHEGAFYAFKYDITQLLKFGEKNLLEVTVAKHSANESVNAAERKADFWIFGGIFRPVYLEVLPQTYIDQVSIDAKENGSFTALITAGGTPGFDIGVSIYDEKGVLEGKITGKPLTAKEDRVHFVAEKWFLIKEGNYYTIPKLWTAETPNLHKAVFTLTKNGKVIHTLSKKFGFRTIEIKQRDGIYVNSVKVKMKGVNRHSFRPETGRTLCKQNSIEDVLLMKDMNMNAVRMSHYPPDDHFLDVCDSLGLFVMDELAGWHGNYDTPTGTKLVKEMIEHDVNHPSIILWSNGNEGGHNTELDSLFTRYDIQERPVLHPWQLFSGIETQHYREYNYGIGNYENGREIVMPTEFLHGQFDGGHGAGLEDYWEKMWHDPLSAGGFLWDFADNAVVRKDKNDSLDTDKFRAADGILGPHHEKEGSYYAIKEIWSPVHFERKEITPQFDGTLVIENRYDFINLRQLVFSYRLRVITNDDPAVGGAISSPNIEPGQKGELRIKLPEDWKSSYVLYVTVKDKSGHEIITKSFPIIKPDYVEYNLDDPEGKPAPLVTESDSLFVAKANGIEISIHKRTGLLTAVKVGSKVVPFNDGPVIQEGANNFGAFTVKRGEDRVIISSAFDRKEHYNTLEWTIYGSGIVRMEIHYFPAAYFTSLAGVNFSYPEQRIKRVDYMGDGPYRVWKNRMKGTQFDVWKKMYNNTETGEYPWVYPEFKGYYSNVYWTQFNGDDHTFKVWSVTENTFLRLFTPTWKTDQWHNYEPIFPSGDISFMNGISSIGTKTQRNETTGPMGMKNIFYDYEKDPSRALKMVLYFDFSATK